MDEALRNFAGIDYRLIQGSTDVDIKVFNTIQKVSDGDLFLHKGFSTDGHKYAEAAQKWCKGYYC